MDKSREGWKNRGSGGSREGRGSRVLFERFRPPHDTVLKNGIVWRGSMKRRRSARDMCPQQMRLCGTLQLGP